MKTIWKFELTFAEKQMLMMPIEVEPLSAQLQNGILCLWARVDSKAPKQPTEIILNTTGNELHPETGIFVDTVQVQGLVVHVYMSSTTHPF